MKAPPTRRLHMGRKDVQGSSEFGPAQGQGDPRSSQSKEALVIASANSTGISNCHDYYLPSVHICASCPYF